MALQLRALQEALIDAGASTALPTLCLFVRVAFKFDALG